MKSFASDGAPHCSGPERCEIQLAPPRSLHFEANGYTWIRPVALAEVLDLLSRYGANPEQIKLVNGNTSVGIYKRSVEDPHVLVDVSHIPELLPCELTEGGIRAGGGVTLARLLDIVDRALTTITPARSAGFRMLRDHVKRIANVQVRGVASLAGNIMLVVHHLRSGSPFPSDLVTLLTALGARAHVDVAGPTPREIHCSVEELVTSPPREPFLLRSLFIPASSPRDHALSFKISRRLQNAHAMVNAAFVVGLSEDGTVQHARLAYGGIARTVTRATGAETSLVGGPWSEERLRQALTILHTELAERIIPMPEDGVSTEYRLRLATHLFYKLGVHVAAAIDPSSVAPRVRSAGETYQRAISHGKQHLTRYPFESPVGDPVVHVSAFAQAAGEATYTRDLAYPRHTLHGSYVYGERAHARFDYDFADGARGLAAHLRERFPGVVDYVTVADIPEGGINLQGNGDEDPIFADGLITAYGMPIGLVLADDPATAEQAAAYARGRVRYDDLKPIFTIEEARALPDGAGILPGGVQSVVRPGSDMQWLEAPGPRPDMVYATGEQRTGAQSHFYMETQACLVEHGDMGALIVNVSSQDLVATQIAVARALGMADHAIEVKVVRLGGAYGGKETKPPLFAAAAAVAATKWKRPVRIVLDRNTDMLMVGTRHPFTGRYHVNARPDGTITDLEIEYASNAGNTIDKSVDVMNLALLGADGAYRIDTFGAFGTCYRTNLQSRTAMRSFGFIQCTLVREEGIEHVAHELGMLPEDVRAKNFYRDAALEDCDVTPYGQVLRWCMIHDVWRRLRESSDFDARSAAVMQYNRENRWRKRGISMIPMKYGVSRRSKSGNQASAYVAVHAHDGSVLVRQGGVEMGQGLTTKIAQIAALCLGIPMSRVRVAGADTSVIPNASATGASTGSDLNGGAVKLACEELRRRLVGLCEEQEHRAGFPDWRHDWAGAWPAVVQAAYQARVNLACQAFYRSPGLTEMSDNAPQGRPFYYFTYAAAVSEVEIDVLTGEQTILRSDILYDAGLSLSSAIDVGQIEGGFVMGVGNVTTEEVYYADDGRLVPNGTWNYKPPCSKSIPVDFRVSLYDYGALGSERMKWLDPHGVQSSKATSEPGLVLANTVFFAIKHAILAARKDAGDDGWFELPSPATAERIAEACAGAGEALEIYAAEPSG
ncbi:Xanthine dehydrogenase, molybdenum binding subunit protein [Minicystis rosea]|nr:Xanthine dehydrogenase, molybdenum binding subunit protein [Minicystis rosea]